MHKPSPAKFFGIGLFVIIAIFGFGFVTMLLWNALIPPLFSGPVVSYWQAMGLLILSKLFFSGGHGSSHRNHSSRHKSSWKVKLGETMRSKSNEGSDEHVDLKTSEVQM